MLLIIDNYDSFTYNLVQYFGELGAEVRVIRNDEMTVDEVVQLAPSAIVISPGPGSPDKDSGISNDILRRLSGRLPILGVCLGQQCMGHVFGGQVVRAPNGVMHGKVSPVFHNGRDLFAGLPSPLNCTRYHSLIVIEPLPADLEATAHTADGELMAVRHKTHPTFGVQFHPESILTEHGKDMLANFLRLAAGWAVQQQ